MSQNVFRLMCSDTECIQINCFVSQAVFRLPVLWKVWEHIQSEIPYESERARTRLHHLHEDTVTAAVCLQCITVWGKWGSPSSKLQKRIVKLTQSCDTDGKPHSPCHAREGGGGCKCGCSVTPGGVSVGVLSP